MVRTQSKTSTAAPVVVPVVSTPVVETKSAAPVAATKKVVKKEVPTPVEVAPVVVAPAPTDAATDSSSSREDRHKSALKVVDDQIAALKALRASLVSNYKADTADLKAAQKSSGRRRRAAPVDENAPKRAPSGITKPTKVSDAMCEFMGRPHGELVARTEVTKFITNYIKTHNLKDEAVKRHINPDAKLRALLNIPQGDQLTYFNLQKYMTSHFPAKVQA
jgi:chromatin remodeling complex protein RSC6